MRRYGEGDGFIMAVWYWRDRGGSIGMTSGNSWTSFFVTFMSRSRTTDSATDGQLSSTYLKHLRAQSRACGFLSARNSHL